MIHQFVAFLFWNLHFWIIFFYTNWWINMVLCITCTMCYGYYSLDHHVCAWMV